MVPYGLTPQLDLDVAGRRRHRPRPYQRVLLIGTGTDSPQASVEAITGNVNGSVFCSLLLSLSPFLFLVGSHHTGILCYGVV